MIANISVKFSILKRSGLDYNLAHIFEISNHS